MVLKNKNAGIFKMRINIGKYFSEEGAEIKDDDFYVVLREPTSEEALTMKTLSENEKEMFDKMPSYIVEHNFETEDGKPMTVKDVWAEIMRRSACSTYIVSEWGSNIPLAKQSQKKSKE